MSSKAADEEEPNLISFSTDPYVVSPDFLKELSEKEGAPDSFVAKLEGDEPPPAKRRFPFF